MMLPVPGSPTRKPVHLGNCSTCAASLRSGQAGVPYAGGMNYTWMLSPEPGMSVRITVLRLNLNTAGGDSLRIAWGAGAGGGGTLRRRRRASSAASGSVTMTGSSVVSFGNSSVPGDAVLPAPVSVSFQTGAGGGVGGYGGFELVGQSDVGSPGTPAGPGPSPSSSPSAGPSPSSTASAAASSLASSPSASPGGQAGAGQAGPGKEEEGGLPLGGSLGIGAAALLVVVLVGAAILWWRRQSASQPSGSATAAEGVEMKVVSDNPLHSV